MTPTVVYRVVLDTNVVIGAGSRWLADEPPQPVTLLQRLIHCVADRHVGLFCSGILDEYIELMERRNHPPDRIARFVAFILFLFTEVTVTATACHTPPTDPDDVIFVLCALDGNADLLVAQDAHLLGISTAYHPRPNILHPNYAVPLLTV